MIHRQLKTAMTRSIINKYFLIIIYLLLSSCSGLKLLPPGEKLYTGAEIELERGDIIGKKKRRLIKRVTEETVLPLTNKSYLGMRPKLWIYLAAGENPETKPGKWLKKKGTAPVLMSGIKPGVTASIIDANLFNTGIFKGYTDFNTIEKKHTAKVIYTSYIHKPYTFSELTYAVSDDSLSRFIISAKEQSLIKPGNDYNLDILKNERIRIDVLLKDKGYFYFSPEYLLFKADTSSLNQTVSLNLALKDSIPINALTVYRINNVFINQDYTLSNDGADSPKDTLWYRNNTFSGKESEMNIRPGVILRSVYLRKNEIYSRRNHTITLNRLMSMGNFKFVQVKFSESDTAAAGFLDVTILLTTMTNRTFRAEMDIVSKSNNFTGPRINVSLLNRNMFRGAELLYMNMAGSYEAQLTGIDQNLYSYSVNPQVELTFPRFFVPFDLRVKNSIYIPITRLSLSYNYLKRVNYFDMQTIQFGYGYRWKENIRKQHEFNPINLSYTSIGNQSAIFKELLDSNPFLKKSYEEQFIGGGNYSFTYNEQIGPVKKMQYFFHGTAEMAGNVFSLAKLTGGVNPSSDNPSTIIGSIYSQYAKISIDTRAYYNFRNNKLAMRFFAGVAKPFGNSSILPYTKQFFSGGSNSLRAFHINSVGPGTYFQDSGSRGFLQLGGEIKLEVNGEYRFNIYRFFKGSLFVDAGNVWLHKSNPANIGNAFSFSGFMNEIAMGAGAGVRIDVSFFLLRFDLAMPLRKPWLEENNRWVINQIAFGNSTWRKDNLVLNVAIGYPF